MIRRTFFRTAIATVAGLFGYKATAKAVTAEAPKVPAGQVVVRSPSWLSQDGQAVILHPGGGVLGLLAEGFRVSETLPPKQIVASFTMIVGPSSVVRAFYEATVNPKQPRDLFVLTNEQGSMKMHCLTATVLVAVGTSVEAGDMIVVGACGPIPAASLLAKSHTVYDWQNWPY